MRNILSGWMIGCRTLMVQRLKSRSDFLQQNIGHLLVDGNGACGITTACYLAGMGVTIFVFLEIMHNHGLVLQGGRARVTA